MQKNQLQQYLPMVLEISKKSAKLEDLVQSIQEWTKQIF